MGEASRSNWKHGGHCYHARPLLGRRIIILIIISIMIIMIIIIIITNITIILIIRRPKNGRAW